MTSDDAVARRSYFGSFLSLLGYGFSAALDRIFRGISRIFSSSEKSDSVTKNSSQEIKIDDTDEKTSQGTKEQEQEF